LEFVIFCKKKDDFLNRPVVAFEKIDGTNFGVRCDGVLFGRRNKVEGLTYQKVPVMHAPNGEKNQRN